MANPNYVNYAMEVFREGAYQDWYYTPRNGTVIDKLLNSGAAYRPLRAGARRGSFIQLSPAIDQVRFQRYRFSLATGDEDGIDRGLAISFFNTLHLVIAAVNLVSDLSAISEMMKSAHTFTGPTFTKCSQAVTQAVAAQTPDAITGGRLKLDADPRLEPSDQAWSVFTTIAAPVIRGLLSKECGSWFATLSTKHGPEFVSKLLTKAGLDTAALATPLGWAKLAFDSVNEALPVTVSYFAPSAGSVDYYLTWDENKNGNPYISGISERAGPQAEFIHMQQGGFRVALDASSTVPGDSNSLTYGWSAEGSSIGTGEHLTHDFGAEGSYLVELTVTDGNGLTDASATRVDVTSGQAPILSDLVCTTESNNRFRASAVFSDADNDITTVQWRSDARSGQADRTTQGDVSSVVLSASRAATWASVVVIDAAGNRDSRTCFVNTSNRAVAKLYWLIGSAVQRANLDGSDVETVVDFGVNLTHGDLTVDLATERLFVADPITDRVRRADLDGSNRTTLGGHQPTAEGVAHDGSGWLYFTALGIHRLSLNGSNLQTLIPNLPWPQDIVLDPEGSMMYWVDHKSDKIQRARTNGHGIEDLATSRDGVRHPEGITLDLASRKLYWTDLDRRHIRRASLDGSDKETVLSGLYAPYSVEFDPVDRMLYWNEGRDIHRSQPDGSNAERIVRVSSTIAEPVGLTVVRH